MMERFSKRNVSCSRNVIALTMEGQRKNIVMERKRVSEAEVERKKNTWKNLFPRSVRGRSHNAQLSFQIKKHPT